MAPSSLPSTADYIIVGGGTAGLILASRLSEDPQSRVLVLESGPDRSSDPQVQDPNAWPVLSGSDLDWKLKIIPQPGLNNREQDHPAGKVLGGCSAINGLAFVPPSPAGIDAWAKLGNPMWTWASLEPYLRKAYTLSPPDQQICSDIQVDRRNSTATTGPIQVTYPSLLEKESRPLIHAWNDAFKEKGYGYVADLLAADNTIGTRAYTATIDPKSGYRSSADSQYGAVAANRTNVTITTGATVRRVLFSASPIPTATGVEVSIDGQVVAVRASKEVILAAGAFHTPKLLELSGVGDKNRLDSLGIPLVVENRHVGENLQNHLMSVMPVPLQPRADLEAVPPGIKALAFVRLDQDEQKELLSQHISNTMHESVIRSLIQHPTEASACLFLSIMPGNIAVLGVLQSLPYSRGSTHISSPNPEDMPTIDPSFLSHELDIEVLARHVRTLYELPSAPSLQPFLQPVNGPTDLEAIKDVLRETAMTTHHTCGTAAMRPQEDGGVVDQELRVYGTRNLRIVDASVFPLIPHANPIATVYAVAERAADLIRGGENI